ncbi:hypothetical protein [Spiroplasma platyhelix]|uniref:Nucleotidyltransferase n=1 Tax=Spiroplasma platyhelix PALS-1 TaxID=1276218 RepID=A0A846U1P1_9MOLU|nr:hypothetical protein [Spiroplasma platyhelix]MBE4704059.1 hypothetical protein [Spiroplasma platyhelix PALS-1]NKE38429.1 hypothetical protein [Spiroplasma platyhelix PALS-1]UJB29317.1 hypothetical protein SPLAT_v1c05530 [Spiroplasma platyhelix PALS-1]
MQLKYLVKKETKLYKKEFIDKANEIIKLARNDFSICFTLVGSSKRNMILIREDIPNPSFDFDYQLLITNNKDNKSAKEIKDYFMKLFQKKFETKNWKVQDSTSAITIKKKNNNYSYDVAIVQQNLKTLKADILKHYKTNNEHKYSWETIREYKTYRQNLKKIKGVDLWNELREIYKDKKTNNNETKSYLLFIQSVNELVK